MELTFINLLPIIISVLAMMGAIATAVAQVYSNRKNANAVFSNLWFELDQMFIENPKFHKYFYTHCTEQKDGPYDVAPIDNDNTETFEQALCIAERIVDVFQYAELFKKSLNKSDLESYEKFKKRMFSTSFMRNTVKPIWMNNGSDWIFSEDE